MTTDTPAEQPITIDDESRSAWGRIWHGLSWVLVVLAFAIMCATILVPKAAGARPYSIVTGSMEPAYPPGALIVVRPRQAESIRVGDVITYQLESGRPGVVTHRVVEVTDGPDGRPRFITRGDANGAVDVTPVRPVQIRGVLWYSVPYLGYVNTWFTGNFRTVTVYLLATLLIGWGLYEFYRDYRSRDEEERPS